MLGLDPSTALRAGSRGRPSPHQQKQSQAPAVHCTRKSPLPLLPSGPGGVGGKTSRGTDAWLYILARDRGEQEWPHLALLDEPDRRDAACRVSAPATTQSFSIIIAIWPCQSASRTKS